MNTQTAEILIGFFLFNLICAKIAAEIDAKKGYDSSTIRIFIALMPITPLVLIFSIIRSKRMDIALWEKENELSHKDSK